MNELWINISNSGVTDRRPYQNNRKVRLQNKVGFLISLLGSVFVVINLFSHKITLAYTEVIVIGILTLCIVLNGKRRYALSSLLFYATLDVMVVLFCFVFSPKRDLEYLLLLFGVLQIFFFESRILHNVLFLLSLSLFFVAKIFAYGIQDIVMYFNYTFIFLIAFFIIRYLKREFEEYQKVIEAQNNQLKKLNGEKEHLISIASHDLRSPLARIQGLLGLLSTKADAQPEERELIGLMENEITQQLETISEVLDIHALSEDATQIKLEQVDALAVIKNMVASFQLVAMKKNITILLQHDDEGYRCVAHTNYLKKVTENLISNALKFSNRHTEITITLARTNERLCISFRDEGPGRRT